MNFDYSEDQKMIKAEARKFLEAESPIARNRHVLENPALDYDEALWSGLAAQGWTGLSVPEAYGGQGLGYVELCALAEELGRALAPVPFASTIYLFVETLLLSADTALLEELLPQVARGDMIGVVAAAEAPGPLALDRIEAHVADGRLTGSKLPVTDGMAGHRAIVLARGPDGSGLYLADLGHDTISRSPLDALDPSRGSARITFAGTPVRQIGGQGGGAVILERVFDRAAVLLAFEQLGGADRCLEAARDYALERYAFGRPIGSYQAIKHKLADMYVRNELARSNAFYGAWALDGGASELPTAASAARIAASDAYWFAAKETIQVHGGIGFTWEMDCHLHYRRALQLGAELGASQDWRKRLTTKLAAAEGRDGL